MSSFPSLLLCYLDSLVVRSSPYRFYYVIVCSISMLIRDDLGLEDEDLLRVFGAGDEMTNQLRQEYGCIVQRGEYLKVEGKRNVIVNGFVESDVNLTWNVIWCLLYGEFLVPRASVRTIIGTKGREIRRLERESGTKIQFKRKENPNSSDCRVEIQGTPDQIIKAIRMISVVVNRCGTTAQSQKSSMQVPANMAGLVIGDNGVTIHEICNETGACVTVSDEPNPTKEFKITGSGYQIHRAQHLIRIKIGEISPGTPVPEYHGSGQQEAQGDQQTAYLQRVPRSRSPTPPSKLFIWKTM
ncbi:hypothetical protein L596_000670 [Steinernema carpocapsae]|uniref:K Homology domain-containing protein n=1 Tax=Steinernema carpocapsae TaxID=34508 RepID=A0A4U8UJH0_STECR|nr:hypothetical protein L596_000670 [Steinernema carpocapsae]